MVAASSCDDSKSVIFSKRRYESLDAIDQPELSCWVHASPPPKPICKSHEWYIQTQLIQDGYKYVAGSLALHEEPARDYIGAVTENRLQPARKPIHSLVIGIDEGTIKIEENRLYRIDIPFVCARIRRSVSVHGWENPVD